MAELIKCKSCNAEVSKNAKACPQCGDPVKRKPIGCGGAIVLVFLVAVVAVTIQNQGGSGTSVNRIVQPSPKVPGSQWTYSQNEDAMSDGQISRARVRSSNTVNFGFPYAGAQHGALRLSTHPRYGKSLIFQIREGQILCTSYDGCVVLVRFDDGEAIKFNASEPADSSTEYVIINNYHGFVEKMLKAKRVRISVRFYQEGNQVFDFDVSDFSQSKYLPNK